MLPNRTEVEAFVIFLSLLLVLPFFVPPLKDDTTKPQVMNLDTKQLAYQKTANEIFLIAIFVVFFVSWGWLIFNRGKENLGRRRSIVEVWEDIPHFEKIKFGLPTTLDKVFVGDNVIPIDDIYSMIRFPLSTQGVYKYIVVDMLDDWKKRSTTPIYSFYEGNMGLQYAKNLLAKRQSASRALQQLKQFGFSPEEVRLRLLEKARQEEEKKEKYPTEDEYE